MLWQRGCRQSTRGKRAVEVVRHEGRGEARLNASSADRVQAHAAQLGGLGEEAAGDTQAVVSERGAGGQQRRLSSWGAAGLGASGRRGDVPPRGQV